MVSKEERILRRLFGDQDEYSLEQVELARRAIEIANADDQRSRIPRRDIRIGETFEKKGVEYRCVRRGEVRVPSEACSGCDILRHSNHCEAPRCSKWDRTDGQNVWFVEVK